MLHDRPVSVRLVVESVDACFEELVARKEDGVDGTGPAHTDPQPSVHVALEELDLDRLHFLALGIHERVPLVDALCRVYGICSSSRHHCVSYGMRVYKK